MHRFYHKAGVPDSGEVALSREESHHAMRVLRCHVGDEVTLFDGAGRSWRGRIDALSRNEVRVAVSAGAFTPRPTPAVALLQAWLHRDKVVDELVRQATVLGVSEIIFFRGEHSDKKPKLSDKWERLCIEACKQCGRVWLPKIQVVDDLAAALESVSGHRLAIARMDGPHVPMTELAGEDPVAYLVGPEGDFSAGELEQASRAGALPVSHGAYTYRAEMAAQVGLTLIQYELGHLDSPAAEAADLRGETAQ